VSDEVDLGSIHNPPHSIVVKPKPHYLEEMRNKDPQGTIDALFARKEVYKAAGHREYQRRLAAETKIKEIEAKLIESENRTSRYKAKFRKEQAMKNRYKYAAISIASASAVLIVALLVYAITPKQRTNDIPKVPVGGMAQRTPSHVLASVNIFNGDHQGSGTIISKGEKSAALLSAAHNFKGVLGGNFWIYYPDGTYTNATLLAVDRERDLALAKVDASTILGHSYLPRKIVDGEINGVGYTDGQGPNYRKLVYSQAYYNSAQKYMWEFGVSTGSFWNGDSGSGVFIDEALVAVTSQRDAFFESFFK
jgi:hypothetical protein